MNQHAVAIVGGGPTGMMLAAELTLAGVDVVVLERRTGGELLPTRARGIHSRTIEVLDQRGIADRFLAEGYTAQVAGFGGVPLDISDFPTRHPYGLALVQAHMERILLGWTEELGVSIERGREVVGLAQDENGVDISLVGGSSLRAAYLVGCDGGRSFVRKASGIAFPGSDPTVSHIMAEVELAEEPPEWGLKADARGIHSLVKAENGKVHALVTESEIGTEEPTLGDLSAALVSYYGTDYGVHSPSWISRFTDMARQAEQYRMGRVLLAGDAAHIHYPVGGQGLGIGLQDAVNLGWKLALVVKGKAPDSLLDTYHVERHQVAARVLRDTMAAVAVARTDDRSKALRTLVVDLLGIEGARKWLAGVMTGLNIRYDLGQGHPLLGRRMPDLDLGTSEGTRRVFSMLHEARPLIINFGTPLGLDLAPWSDRVRRVDATYAGAWELPVIGAVPAPTAVLVRPDGYVAWVGQGSDAGLAGTLTTWFGPPA